METAFPTDRAKASEPYFGSTAVEQPGGTDADPGPAAPAGACETAASQQRRDLAGNYG